MHISERRFWEGFFLYFISLYFIVHQSPHNVLWYITFSVSQEQCSNTALWEKRYNSLTGMHTSQICFSESFYPVFIRRYLLFPQRSECAPECPCANPSMTQFQNCVIEGKFYLCEMNRGIYHKAVSPKASFQFLCESISFFTIAVHITPNVPWSLFLQTGFPNPLWEEKYNSVSGMHTSQSSSSQVFSPDSIWRCFRFSP